MVVNSGGSAADYERAPRRFFIVDSHPAIRRSLACLIERRLDSHVLAEAASALEGLRRAQECRPEVAIVDVRLDQTDGVALMQRLADLSPNLRIVGYSFNDDCGTVSRFLAAGGHAFVSKHEPTEALIEAIDCALAGKLRVAFSESPMREDSQGEAETSA